MGSLKTWLIHLKIIFCGDKTLEKKGKFIPCIECDKKFKSYTHYRSGGMVFDDTCQECMKRRRE